MSIAGERLKALRIAAGMSAEELGQRIGKNRATIYRYENEDIENMPVCVLKPLAEALKTTPAYLMGWEEDSTAAMLPAGMSDEEDELLALYRNANNHGKEYILYIARLISTDTKDEK